MLNLGDFRKNLLNDEAVRLDRVASILAHYDIEDRDWEDLRAALATPPPVPATPALDVEAVALAEAVRDFAGYVPFSRLRKGGREAWNRLRPLLDKFDRNWPARLSRQREDER